MLSLVTLVNGAGPRVSVPISPTQLKLNDLVPDFVVDLTITDVDENDAETEEQDQGIIKCIAPPCGLRMAAEDISDVPISWDLRLAPPV